MEYVAFWISAASLITFIIVGVTSAGRIGATVAIDKIEGK
jgi:hypothetical protein